MTFHYNPLHEPPDRRIPFVPAELTDPALATDQHPRILTRLLDDQHGYSMLSRLAVGDQTALTEAGVVTRGVYDTQVHEWGLGYDAPNQDYYLVAGGPGMVKWGDPALQGLESVAHTHPLHLIDHDEVTRGLAGTVAGALGKWLAEMFDIPVVFMPGDFWYLFPSNQDVAAAYYTSHQNSELVYTPFRLAPDGWLSQTQGPTLAVRFGPVRARLTAKAEDVVRTTKFDVRDPASLQKVEESCLHYLWCPVAFQIDGYSIVTGHFQVDPQRGTDGRSPQFAWFRPDAPGGLFTRAQVHQFIRKIAGF